MANLTISDTLCVHELFESHVEQNPCQTALVCGEVEWSYEELDRRANQLARHLKSCGIGPGNFVGLFMRRSENSILAILAVLKAGAAYVPIDPAFPDMRIGHILEEAEVTALLTEQAHASRAKTYFGGLCIICDDSSPDISAQSTDRLSIDETGVTAEDLCYVLYTSGSTGRPKGVMTEHRNVVRFVQAFNEELRLTSEDRVYHGFALGFDGSVEEMWMAFSNGACLVVGTTEIAHVGNEAAKLLCDLGISVLSTVPTCLGMIHDDIPSLRLIIVSGEPCPAALVNKWATNNRRMLNVYGPTETTVNATVAECVPNEQVTIGRPLNGYEALILDRNMQPVPPGNRGELYIGGVGLARGYLGQPDQTIRQFVDNPLRSNGHSSKLYRTGDLVERTATGDLVFHGRIDRQVKVRGYRIELAEIESVLRGHSAIDQAVVNIVDKGGQKELAAYVVPANSVESIDRDEILNWLKDHVPHYMIPSFLDNLDVLPTLDSGKVDRNRLPAPKLPLVPVKRSVVEPRNELESRIVSVWEKLFSVSSISIEDDFFLDLGGYSLLAVEMALLLRKEYGYDVAIRDVYMNPTVVQLAEHVSSSVVNESEASLESSVASPAPVTSREVFQSVPRLTRYICYCLQAVSVAVIYSLAATPLLIGILLTFALLTAKVSLNAYIWSMSAAVFFAPLVGILLSIAVKWVVIGRYKPGEYPVWGFYYFRWWLVTRTQFLAWTDIYIGSPLMSFYYRLMGAQVGKNSLFDSNNCVIFDLLSVGDDTCIGSETHFLGYRVEDGLLKIGSIEIGSRCFVGTQCALGINTRMEDDALLDDMSLLPDNSTIGSGEAFAGSPAQPATVKVPDIDIGKQVSSRRTGLYCMLHFISSEIFGEILLLGIIMPIALLLIAGFRYGGAAGSITSLFMGLPLCLVWFCLFVAAVKRTLLPKSDTGVHSLESWVYLKRWSADLFLRYASSIVYPVYSTIFLPSWLRMLGANIGSRAEISTVTHVTPDLVTIGQESFLADGSMIGGRRLYRGHFQVSFNRIGSRTFLGNGALLPDGIELGSNCLVGVLSVPPTSNASEFTDNTEWLGSPPFRLPHREKVQGFDDATIFRPTLRLYVTRIFIDGLRVLLPYYIGMLALALFSVCVVAGVSRFSPGAILALVPVLVSFLVVFSLLLVVAIKQICMGTIKPVIKPLWCVYIWLNELTNAVFEMITMSLAWPLFGTPFFSSYLRLLGCKIGKGAFIETELFSEFDLVSIGNYAALNSGAVIQNHLFEDRIMKSSSLVVGDECSVGNMSIVLYDSEMQQGSSIGPLSLLMKGDSLPEKTRWIGIPINQLRDPGNSSHDS
ncbi:Pls/PosA family non-ribosomal peptide synthetase [Bythopirellula goksoeyrii]|uniref:Linear gramicidin synthase subunit D n=1 Tax=Bythopirellula goksoeyrii TaxID=1400387 RepID=A0A5B9Q5K4_9BACT|nr:Pls/PosA family non-ribosomal peptide synthetase [Bythopirellula goksoeyrii]QEG32949.1 Linear gramicidin synthase subunit D [Bythopirellula goksoeyrii]